MKTCIKLASLTIAFQCLYKVRGRTTEKPGVTFLINLKILQTL